MELRRSNSTPLSIFWSAIDLAILFSESLQVEVTPNDCCRLVCGIGGAAVGKTDQTKADEPKADEPKADEPKADEPKADEPKADEQTAEEKPSEAGEKVNEPEAKCEETTEL